LKYEPAALIKLLENSACSTEVLAEVGESVFPIEFKEEGHDDHDEEGHDDHDEEGHDDHDEEGHDDHEGHGHGAYDPHFWFDPNRVAYAAEYIESKLVQFDPSNASVYEAAGKAYVTELKGLVGQVSELISTIPSQNRKLITTHESLGYLEAKFGLEVLSTIIPSLDSANEISPLQLVGVIDVIEDNNVKVIFIEAEAPSVYAETIVAETGIKAVKGLWVETLKEGQSYPEFLFDAVELIVENLRNTD
jgi:ABC-type Zn uptake system ZnuABC Zn-binding protein ZnuA